MTSPSLWFDEFQFFGFGGIAALSTCNCIASLAQSDMGQHADLVFSGSSDGAMAVGATLLALRALASKITKAAVHRPAASPARNKQGVTPTL